MLVELVIARNPDPESSLPYLLRLPIAGGLVFRAGDTWPRTKAIFCYPVPAAEWPDHAEVVERVPLLSCQRRGAAIDVVVDRAREARSQIVYTHARGREMVFWQSPRTRRQARPQVRPPRARAAGIANLEIIADVHERYPYRFAGVPATVARRPLPCGDYGVTVAGRLVASVERKSLPDLVSSLLNGRLRFALGELAALPRAAVVVEERWSQVFALDRVRPAQVADGLAELQVRWPNVPIFFAETRPLAEQWVYRFLAAAATWARDEPAAIERLGAPAADPPMDAPAAPGPSAAEVRAWARGAGLAVPERGRLGPEIVQAWHDAHAP